MLVLVSKQTRSYQKIRDFYFLLSPNLILCLGSTSPHVWQEMKSQSGTGARTHLIERKPRCEFLSRLYLDTTIFPGIIPWFEQNLKNINISDTNGGLGLNPNWKRGRDQIKKDWKNILIMGLVFLNVFDGHFRLFCHWVMTAEVAGPVVSTRPRPLPFLIMMRLKLADTACCDEMVLIKLPAFFTYSAAWHEGN